METINRFRGCLLGLAIGDAVGAPVEFQQPGTFQPLTDMVSGGPFRLKPGQWTDDTSLALCLAESLVQSRGFDPQDQMRRYVRWYREGYLSSTGHCFDIGSTTRAALERFEQTGEVFCSAANAWSASNGSLMRLAPIPMFFAVRPAQAIERSGEGSRTTHGAAAAVDACRYFGGLLVGSLNGTTKEQMLSPRYSPVPDYWEDHALTTEILSVANGSYRREPPEISAAGNAVKTLEAALWAFNKTDSFRDGCLLAANLGDDADTTAAVYGQIAGAFYGESGIPKEWRAKLAMSDFIESLAGKLCELCLQAA